MHMGLGEDTSALILLPFLLLIAAIGPFWLQARLKAYLARSAKARLAELSWPELPRTRLLTAAYQFDEARSYLDYLDRASSRLSRRLWRTAELTLLGLLAGAFTAGMIGEMPGVVDVVDTTAFRSVEIPAIFAIYALVIVALALPSAPSPMAMAGAPLQLLDAQHGYRRSSGGTCRAFD
jgi:hypothetical protein